jgi:hypothetical protein
MVDIVLDAADVLPEDELQEYTIKQRGNRHDVAYQGQGEEPPW